MKKQNKKSVIQAQALYVIQQIGNVPTAIPVVIMEDETIHTDEHPRCSDESCPCQEPETFEYSLPENGRTYRTSSSRWTDFL